MRSCGFLRGCKRRRDYFVVARIDEIGTLGLLTKRTYGGRSHWKMGVPVVYDDAVENCEYEDVGYASDLTDAESDDECVFTPMARVERVGSWSSKRTYGVIVGNGVAPERRVRRRIDEKIEELRAVIPYSCTVSSTFSFLLFDFIGFGFASGQARQGWQPTSVLWNEN